jgi:5-methylcytosine-specific restriction endonuclease McrA
MWMDDEELRQLDIRRAQYSQQEQMDLLREYVELRLLLKDPYATMKVYVLEPLCEYCRFGRMPMEDGESLISSAVPIHGHRENCYMYPGRDGGNFYAAAYGRIIRPADGHEISCVQCQEDLSEETMMYVRERSFQEYFCLQDESRGLPKWLRKHILDCYGRTCFACGAALSASTLSIDHIIPLSRGGDHRPTNLQAMCGPCNNVHKKDTEPEVAHIFLDFLTRPAPSDSYSGLIW